MTMKLYLIRHGETDWNAEKRLQGSIDTELNAVGRAQAEAFIPSLESVGITLIYSSNLKRALQTAEILAHALAVPLSVDERLRECSFGTIEGLTLDELAAQHGGKQSDFFGNDGQDYDFRDKGGEDRNGVIERQLSFLSEIKECGADAVLLVGHGTSFNSLLSHLGHPPGLQRGEIRTVEY